MKRLPLLLAMPLAAPAAFAQTWNYTTIPPTSYSNGALTLGNVNFNTSALTWSGVTTPGSTDTYYYGSGTASGTATTDTAPRGRLAFKYFQITSDTVQVGCTVCASQSPTLVYDWTDITVGANWRGYRIGQLTYFTLNNPPVVCITNGGCDNSYSPNYVGSQQIVNMASHMNGLPLSANGANGALFGGNTNLFANPGSSFDNSTGVWDWEFDISFNSTGSAWKKIGVLVRNSGNRSYGQDSAFTVALNSGNNVGDQGTFRLVYNAGSAYAATAAMAGDSTGFGFGRRESGAAQKDTIALYPFSALNVALTNSGCYYISPQYCVDGSNAVNATSVNVVNGITQQSTTVSGINVLTTGVAFTGFVSGSTLTLSTFPAGAALGRGQTVYCAGCTPAQFYVGPPLTGGGPVGSTYTTSAPCTAGCGTGGSPVAMTTGQEALGPFGYSGGMLVMADNLGQMVAFPGVVVDPPATGGANATTNGGTLVLNGLAVPQGYIPANSCAGATPITIGIPGNAGTNPTMQLTVSGGNITGATVVTPGNIPSGYSTGTGNFMTVSGDSCGAGAALALSQYLVFGISGVTMNSHGTQYSCAAPPRVVLGGGHQTTVETVPTFEAVLGSCVAGPVPFPQGVSINALIAAAGTAPTIAITGTNCPASGVISGGQASAISGKFTVTTSGASATCTITVTAGAGSTAHGNTCFMVDITDQVQFLPLNSGTGTTCVNRGVQTTNGAATYVFSFLTGY